MPKLVHAIPLYRHHKPSGQAVATFAGQDYYLGPWKSTASRTKYDSLLADWVAAGRPRRAPSFMPTLSIAELVLRYWQFAQDYYVKDGQPTGSLPGIKVALRLLRRSYGDRPAAEFGPLSLAAIQNKLAEDGYSRKYCNDHVARIRRVFKWAVSQELISVTVHQALATVPGLKRGRSRARETEPIRPVADSVVDATLPYLPPVVVDMVRLHRLIGCRPTELCQMRPCEVDASASVWWYSPASHKTSYRGDERRIPLGPQAQKVLRPYLYRSSNTYCFSPLESRRRQFKRMRELRQTPVQPSQTERKKPKPSRQPGDSYNKDSYNRAVARACDKADLAAHIAAPHVDKNARLIPRWSPNQLRHAGGTRVRRRFCIEGAQLLLGHARADVTEVYAERDMTKAEAIALEIG